MVVYFANRTMDILGLASTELMEGFHISDDRKTEDIDTGVAVFECTIHWTEDSRLLAKTCATAGNYLLRSNDEEAEFYTIIEVEEDTKDQTIYIYAEDAGMDLLNETVGAFEADEAHPAAWYIEMFADDSGFEIGINEITSLSRKLEWTGEATVAERIASVATQFDNAEVGYSFEISGLLVTKKYINVYKQRGKDVGVTLRLNREVDRIVATTSVADLATALYVTGGIVEGEEDPITLAGYSATADDGDIYTTGDGYVRSKSALAIWSRYLNPNETGTGTGDIVKQWSYDTTSQSELFNRSVTQLQKIYTPAVNYDIEITNMPDNVAIGDNVYIVDEGGDLYLQARILQMETSVCNETQRLTLGDYLINSGGLSSQVSSLTTQLASVQSQATSTAADVYNLNEEVSELSSSTVKSSESVQITLYNNDGTAQGTLSFSNGMSLSLSALFSAYATESYVRRQTGTVQIYNNSGSASGSFSFANGLSLDIKDLFSSYALLSQTAQIRLYSDYGYAYDQFGFQSPLDMSIQSLLPDMSEYATQKWVEDQGYLTSTGSVATAEKLKNAQTFALTFNKSNLDSDSFDGSSGVSLAVDNLLSKDLTFTGLDVFTDRVLVSGTGGQLRVTASMVDENDVWGVGLADEDLHGFLWTDANGVSMTSGQKGTIYVGADEYERNIYVGSSAANVQIQAESITGLVRYGNATRDLFRTVASDYGDTSYYAQFGYNFPQTEILSDNSINIGNNSGTNSISIGHMNDCITTIYGTFHTVNTNSLSDKSVKTNIKPLAKIGIDKLVPVSFKWREGDDRTHYGYIAQDVKEVFPELVCDRPDGLLGLAYTEIIPLLHCKIKEQQSKIESLEERIARLEEIINGR